MAYSTAAFATFAANFVCDTAEASKEDEEARYADVDVTPVWVISVPVMGFVSPEAEESGVSTEESEGKWDSTFVVSWIKLLEFHHD